MRKYSFIICLFLVIVLMISCSENNKPELNLSESTETPAPNDVPDDFVLKIYGASSISDGTEKDTFIELIKREFGIEMKIDNARYDFIDGTYPSDFDGLLLYNGSVSDSINHRVESFYPLNEYLESNETFNQLPTALKESIKDENGTIWYLPLGHIFSLNRRMYSEQIMLENDYQVPYSLDSLIELLEDVKNKYGDTDGFSVMYIDNGFCLRDLQDIIEAYGMIVTSPHLQSSGILAWNEKNNRFEDSIVNADIGDFLTRIRYLADARIIDTDFTINSQNKQGGPSAEDRNTFTGMSSTNMTYPFSSGTLTNNSAEYVYNHTALHLYMPLGVQEPQRTLDAFINTFLGSNKGNIMGVYGESGRLVEYDSSYDIVRILPQSELIMNPENGMTYMIGLVGYWLNNDFKVYSEKGTAEEIEDRGKRKADFDRLVLEGIESGSIVPLSPHKEINLFNMNGFNVSSQETNGRLPMDIANDLFGDMLYRFINEDISVDSFIEKYIAAMKKLGVEDYLNNENEKIPGASRFSYGD